MRFHTPFTSVPGFTWSGPVVQRPVWVGRPSSYEEQLLLCLDGPGGQWEDSGHTAMRWRVAAGIPETVGQIQKGTAVLFL